jgi:hypothetical protein
MSDHPEHTECADGCGLHVDHDGPCQDAPGPFGTILCEHEETCRHCDRRIVWSEDDGWVDPDADGDDLIWRETCDSNHEDRIAAHEPVPAGFDPDVGRDRMKNPSINFPESAEEARQALIHRARKLLFEGDFSLNHVFTGEAGLGHIRTEEQAAWLNEQQAVLRATLEDTLDRIDISAKDPS